MKKPYLKKIGIFSGIKVFYVSGYWIRKNLDKQFSNFGYTEIASYIPYNELWIDYENGKSEVNYWIDYFLAFRKFMKQGKSHALAVEMANKVELRERSKREHLKKVFTSKINPTLYKKAHKTRILNKYVKNLKIWMVRGDKVRTLFDLDFNQGGHGLVYKFIPADEIWIDDDVYKKEIPFVLIHELHERRLMKKGWEYTPGSNTHFRSERGKNSAHFEAEDLEFKARTHPKKTKSILISELKKNELV